MRNIIAVLFVCIFSLLSAKMDNNTLDSLQTQKKEKYEYSYSLSLGANIRYISTDEDEKYNPKEFYQIDKGMKSIILSQKNQIKVRSNSIRERSLNIKVGLWKDKQEPKENVISFNIYRSYLYYPKSSVGFYQGFSYGGGAMIMRMEDGLANLGNQDDDDLVYTSYLIPFPVLTYQLGYQFKIKKHILRTGLELGIFDSLAALKFEFI